MAGDPAPRSVQIRAFNDSVTLDWIRSFGPFHPGTSLHRVSPIRNFGAYNFGIPIIRCTRTLDYGTSIEARKTTLGRTRAAIVNREKRFATNAVQMEDAWREREEATKRMRHENIQLGERTGDLLGSVSCESFVSPTALRSARRLSLFASFRVGPRSMSPESRGLSSLRWARKRTVVEWKHGLPFPRAAQTCT